MLDVRPLQQWTNGCANRIASAKERMATYLQQLCSDQKLSNVHYQHRLQWLARNPRIVEGSVQADVTADGNIGRTASTNTGYQTKEINDAFVSSTDATTYGIIYTGEPKHFQQIHQSITSLVLSISTQSIHTVEVWVNYYALPRCMRVFQNFTFVSCKGFARKAYVQTQLNSRRRVVFKKVDKRASTVVVTGFEAKLHALLQTTLQNVLFLDADNVVTRDVSEVFRNKGYQETGDILCTFVLNAVWIMQYFVLIFL